MRDSWRDSINNACNNTGKEVHRSLLQGPIAYRRSAIITSLLRKMKVSQCYFTPTRQEGRISKARDDSFGWIGSFRLHGQNRICAFENAYINRSKEESIRENNLIINPANDVRKET